MSFSVVGACGANSRPATMAAKKRNPPASTAPATVRYGNTRDRLVGSGHLCICRPQGHRPERRLAGVRIAKVSQGAVDLRGRIRASPNAMGTYVGCSKSLV